MSARARCPVHALVLSLLTLSSFAACVQASPDAGVEPSAVELGAAATGKVESEGSEPLVNPALELAAFDEPEPELATEFVCLGPEPRGRWAGRSSDDEWARGLYPSTERYGERLLALTFDDGPHVSHTPKLLDALARRDQHATFFLTGHAIRKSTYPLVRRMVAEGHTLANHGWRHDVEMAEQRDSIAELEDYLFAELELTQIRVDLALLAESDEEFEAMEARVFRKLHWTDSREEQLAALPRLVARHRELLAEHGYHDGARPYVLSWVRPPGGNPYLGKRWSSDEREAFARVVNRMGLRVAMWNHGSSDSDPALSHAERMDPERIAGTARKAAARGGVYVAHDRVEPEAALALLDALVESDAQLVSLDALFRDKLERQGECR